MRNLLLLLVCTTLLSSCISQKEYAALEAQHKKTKNELLAVKNSLTKCLIEKEKCETETVSLKSNIEELKKDKQKTLEYVDNLTVLTKGANDNIKETLAQLSKKDKYINRIRAAASKKDSLNLVVAFHLKKELKDGIDDEDIEINVEKTVVFISISDKLLFKSGSYNVTAKAKEVLAKVAKVINSKPNFEAMVEAHTDNVPYQKGVLLDNWDLSVKRATSVVRVLESLEVNPQQLVAAGRSYHVPLVANDTAENRATNRRTRIVVLPKIDQFYEMIEEEMKNLSAAGN